MLENPLDTLDSVRAQSGEDTVDSVVAEFNEKYYCVVAETGDVVVFQEMYDPLLKRRWHARMSFQGLRNLYSHRQVVVGRDGEDPVKKGAGGVWLKDPRRKTYEGGVVFDPTGKHARPDQLNLWQGFGVEPKPGDWSKLREHIECVVCSGNEEWSKYVTGWTGAPGDRQEV